MQQTSMIDTHMTEAQILARYREKVEPFWHQQVTQGTFTGVDNIDIHYAYCLHNDPVGSVAISSGRIESLIKYKELVFDLFQAGYSVFIHDHRGQGLSARMTKNSHQGYVDDFADYVTDFKSFYEHVIKPHSATKPYLLCHSMGSAIGALYMLSHPDDFDKVVLCAPMFGIRPALPPWFAKVLVNSHLHLNKLLSDSPWYFWGQGDYQERGFVTNVLTHSESRYKIFCEEYRAQPEVNLGGVTGRWLAEAVVAMNEILQRAPSLVQPILLLQAGADKVVDNKSQQKVVERLPDCNFVKVDGARHEFLMEAERYRAPAMAQILEFLSQD